jgi:hypothetical protein
MMKGRPPGRPFIIPARGELTRPAPADRPAPERYGARVGFSPLGLAVSVAVLAPNLLLWRWPPHPAIPHVAIPSALMAIERAGQALCLVVPLITAPGRISWLWILPAGAAYLGYVGLWARYLVTGRPVSALYGALWDIPVPMAILPVAVFLCAAAWLGNPWIALSAIVLAAGHIPASLRIARGIAPPG